MTWWEITNPAAGRIHGNRRTFRDRLYFWMRRRSEKANDLYYLKKIITPPKRWNARAITFKSF